MSNDLNSGFSINDASLKLLQKSTWLALSLLIFSILYSFIEIREWYIFFLNTTDTNRVVQHFYYNHRLLPLVSLVETILSITGYVYYYRAFKYLSKAAVNNDQDLFSKGIKVFYTSLVISVIYFLILFGNIFFRILIIK
jgi:hypothetical protein